MVIQSITTATDQHIYSVSQLNQLARNTIERGLGRLWISGEISNLAQPSSGHIYFSLKDQRAQVRCALFRNSRQRLKFQPENGQQVMVFAQVSLYEARGEFQVIAYQMELAGDGALQLAFEQLKKRLSQQGLFDPAHKKPIPALPKSIGVITSATGAAIKDILTVLKRRFAAIPVTIYPSLVQGDQAAAQLVSAIQRANQRQECDVLILARGGGSLEDLWPFNEEIVAQAIFDSSIPIVSGVGHEIDFSIADFVADLRAATPSAAAEHVSPNQHDWQQQLQHHHPRLNHVLHTRLQQLYQRVIQLQHRLQHPGQRFQQQMQQLDQLEQRLLLAQQNTLKHQYAQLQQFIIRLSHLTPHRLIEQYRNNLPILQQRLTQTIHNLLKLRRQQLKHISQALNTVSPLQTLQRGYAIATQHQSKTVITDAAQVNSGEAIDIKLAKGQLNCIVKKKQECEDQPHS